MTRTIKPLLDDLDIQMDGQTAEAFSEHFHGTLYESVINRIMKSLSAEQIHNLARIRSDSEQTWQWLQTNVPDLKYIVQEEIYMLIGDVIEHSDDI